MTTTDWVPVIQAAVDAGDIKLDLNNQTIVCPDGIPEDALIAYFLHLSDWDIVFKRVDAAVREWEKVL